MFIKSQHPYCKVPVTLCGGTIVQYEVSILFSYGALLDTLNTPLCFTAIFSNGVCVIPIYLEFSHRKFLTNY